MEKIEISCLHRGLRHILWPRDYKMDTGILEEAENFFVIRIFLAAIVFLLPLLLM